MGLSLVCRQFLLTFLIFILAAPAQMIRVAHANEVRSLPSNERTEVELNDEIDRQAGILLQQIKMANPSIPSSIIEKLHRQAMLRFKQLTNFGEILKSSGKAPATAVLAGTILSNFVAAPLLAYLGKPAEAAVVMTIPWGLVSGASVAAFQVQSARFKVASNLKLPTLGELERIRNAVIGYNIKRRISSAVYQSIEQVGAIHFEVLERAKDRDGVKSSFVTIAELQKIVSSTPEGHRFLEQIFVEQSNRELYSALLLKYASSDDSMVDRLGSLLKERMPLEESVDAVLRKHLIMVDEVRKQVNRDIQVLQARVNEIKRALKAGLITKEEAEIVGRKLKGELGRLTLVKSQVPNHEYALLLAAKSPFYAENSRAIAQVVNDFSASLVQLQDASRLRVDARIQKADLAGKQGFDLRGAVCQSAFAP